MPFADVGPLKVPDRLKDEQVLFLSDILPTGYMAAENCGISRRCRGGLRLRAGRPVRDRQRLPAGCRARDRHRPDPRAAADGQVTAKAEVLNYEEVDVLECAQGDDRRPGSRLLHRRRRARGNGITLDAWYDLAKTTLNMETDRSHALRRAIQACRKGGTVSIPGVYGGLLDKFPMGVAFAKGLTLKMGQTHMHRYMKPLMERIEKGELDPSFVITHRFPLDEARKPTRRSGTRRTSASRSSSSRDPVAAATRSRSGAVNLRVVALPKVYIDLCMR